MHNLKIAPAAERDIGKIRQRASGQDSERLRRAIANLAEEPRPLGVRKLKAKDSTYRIRVGNYRVIYDVYDGDSEVVILRVLRRTEATYR